jgi:hypothetical protein
MLAVEPLLSSMTPAAEFGLEYLLLGDLRQLLEEPPSRESRRWMLAILDRLLAGRCLSGIPEALLERRGIIRDASQFIPPEMVSQLQRLRDRVAHGVAVHGITQELRLGLQHLMESRHVGSHYW